MPILRTLPCLLILTAQAAMAQRPAIDFRGVDEDLLVEPTQILVLGTSHLSQYADTLDPAALDPLRAKLAAYRPDAIAIESVPGLTCESLLAYPDAYEHAGDQYCYNVSPFRRESGLAMDSALTIVRTSLEDWPADPTPVQRRRLAAAFLAANDRYSALVQWLRLDPAERLTRDGLGEASRTHLDELSRSLNESAQLGSHLAAELGLERVYPADDHAADHAVAGAGDSLWSRMREIWTSVPDSIGDPAHALYQEIEAQLLSADGVLAAYRRYNSPEMQRLAVDLDFRRAMNDAAPGAYGRRYLAWWQARNLNMVGHHAAAAADVPGGRLLSIVGSSHKPYFEAYLDQLHDVRLGDVEAVLR